MRGTCFLVVLSFLPLCQPELRAADAFPYKATVRGADVVVRSGPGMRFYATSYIGDGDQVRRRRECPQCKERFTTYERAELSLPRLIKRDQMPEDLLDAL